MAPHHQAVTLSLYPGALEGCGEMPRWLVRGQICGLGQKEWMYREIHLWGNEDMNKSGPVGGLLSTGEVAREKLLERLKNMK